MRLINDGISTSDFQSIFEETIRNKKYSHWYWTVSSIKEDIFNDFILPNLENFQSLCITRSWNGGKTNTTKFLEKYTNQPNIHLIRAEHKFHPKVFLFCSEDEMEWVAFVSSANLNASLSSLINSTAMITQADDDSERKLYKSIKQMFSEIPFSEKNQDVQSREELIAKYGPEINKFLSSFIETIKPYLCISEKKVSYFIEFMTTGNRTTIAERDGITETRVQQIFKKGHKNVRYRICKMQPETKAAILACIKENTPKAYDRLIDEPKYQNIKTSRNDQFIKNRIEVLEDILNLLHG